jgi:hypothetical protein
MRKADLRAGMLLARRERHTRRPVTARLLSTSLWEWDDRTRTFQRSSEYAKPYRSYNWSIPSRGWPTLVAAGPQEMDLAAPQWDLWWDTLAEGEWDGTVPPGSRVEIVTSLASLLPHEAVEQAREAQQNQEQAEKAERVRLTAIRVAAANALDLIRETAGLGPIGRVEPNAWAGVDVVLSGKEIQALADWVLSVQQLRTAAEARQTDLLNRKRQAYGVEVVKTLGARAEEAGRLVSALAAVVGPAKAGE